MTSRSLTTALAVLLVLILTIVVFARPDSTQLNWEFLPEMKRSPAVHAFEITPVFGNGRTQQLAVAGTIPRGHTPLHFTATKEDAVRAGEVLRNPYQPELEAETVVPGAAVGEPPQEGDGAPSSPATDQAKPDPVVELAASTQRGERCFRIYCVACHGAAGAGDGPVAKRGFPPPPPLPTGKSAQMKDGQLFHILTFGQGSMLPMAAQLDRDQRWDVINYVRSLQLAAMTTPPTQSSNTDATPPKPQPVQP